MKQTTRDAIETSQINVSFVKIGNKHKISITFYDVEYAYTCEAWAVISHNKYLRLGGYDTLPSVLALHDFSGERILKETGFTTLSTNAINNKATFIFLCDELAKRTDKVDVDYMVSYKSKP